jgi:hypothetical protein
MTNRILNNLTGATTTYEFPALGEFFTILTSGTFDGATVSFEASGDGTTFVPIADLQITAPGVKNFQLARGFILRAVVFGGGVGQNISLWMAS